MCKKATSHLAFFSRIISVILTMVFFCSSTQLALAGNVIINLLANAEVRISPPRDVVILSSENSATVNWKASLHAVSGSVNGYRVYYKPSSESSYSSCPASDSDKSAGKNCVVKTGTGATFSITTSDLVLQEYDFIVKTIASVVNADFDTSIHESKIDCESCKIENVQISADIFSGTIYYSVDPQNSQSSAELSLDISTLGAINERLLEVGYFDENGAWRSFPDREIQDGEVAFEVEQGQALGVAIMKVVAAVLLEAQTSQVTTADPILPTMSGEIPVELKLENDGAGVEIPLQTAVKDKDGNVFSGIIYPPEIITSPPISDEGVRVSTAISVGSSSGNIVFDKPIKATFPVTGGLDDPKMLFFDESDDEWVFVRDASTGGFGGALDPGGQTISIYVDHFTIFAVAEVDNFAEMKAKSENRFFTNWASREAPVTEDTSDDSDASSAGGGSGGGGGRGGGRSSIIEAVHTTSDKSPFSDLSKEHWAYGFITSLKDRRIVDGYPDSTFLPNNPINRAEFTKIALSAFRKDKIVETKSSFPDVEQESWFKPFVVKAKALGILHGYEDGLFHPNNPVTRAEAIKILINAAGFTTELTESQFIDVSINDWFNPFVAWAEQKGIVGGYPLEFGKYEFPRELKIGSNGKDVGILQFLLREMGFYQGKTSFYFLGFSSTALQKFQQAYLTVGSYHEGVLDEITRNKIYEITRVNRSQVAYEFRPNNPITRAEASKIVSIILDFKEKGFSLDAKINQFSNLKTPHFDLTKVKFEYPLLISAPVEQPKAFTPNSLFKKLDRILGK